MFWYSYIFLCANTKSDRYIIITASQSHLNFSVCGNKADAVDLLKICFLMEINLSVSITLPTFNNLSQSIFSRDPVHRNRKHTETIWVKGNCSSLYVYFNCIRLVNCLYNLLENFSGSIISLNVNFIFTNYTLFDKMSVYDFKGI